MTRVAVIHHSGKSRFWWDFDWKNIPESNRPDGLPDYFYPIHQDGKMWRRTKFVLTEEKTLGFPTYREVYE